MGCIYEDREGICTLSIDDDCKPIKLQLMQGADEDAFCMTSGDPVPSDNCDSYESDWSCEECGVDLNEEGAGCKCRDDDDECAIYVIRLTSKSRKSN